MRENVELGSTLHSDALKSYDGLDGEYEHQVIDHAIEYVRENCHKNSFEHFWSLLKRGISGTYLSVEPYRLFRYVDEQAFRFTYRQHQGGEKMTDAERFDIAMRQIVGRRLMYKELIGKAEEIASIT